MTEEHLNTVWEKNPEYIRRFYNNLEINEKLCVEVKYILSLELDRDNIEVAQISARAKTLKSFCEKISRKSCKDPFDNITDFAGVRVVYLYSTSRKQIESIIEREFEVIEKVDKVLTEDDKFGYGALHYLIKLKHNHAGARYDELKNKVCEIQVRTILQDAWAVVAHHLSYKQEADVPKELRRKLNALSGLFETADDQFENIRNARLTYQNKIQHSISSNQKLSLNEEVNLDNLEAYLKWKFPDRYHGNVEGIADLLEDLQQYGYSNLLNINSMVDSASKAVEAEEKKYPPAVEDNKYNSVGIVRTALVFMCEDFRKNTFSTSRENQVAEFKYLVQQ